MEITEFENIYPLYEIDPDVNFYNELTYKLYMNCRYYHEYIFEMEVKNNKNSRYEYFSVCPINITSIKSNLESFIHYIEGLNLNLPMCVGNLVNWLKLQTI